MNKVIKDRDTFLVRVLLNKRLVERIDEVVKIDSSTRSAFIRSAVSRALKNWSPPTENSHIWPVCPHCQKARHDPLIAHGVDW